MLLWYCNARLKFFQKIRVEDKNLLPYFFTRNVRKAHSFRCGMDSINNVYVDIENIHIV